ncbi:hypothetical protein B0O99DRAFT_585965 [Bisporella sp. PMI_857]|nr:hypothetical protein B0O99DRAFT_585965 [Bisporella sp. PMI_857]
MAGRIRFGLYSGYNSIDTNCAWRTPWSCGETQPSLILGYVRVFIAIEMLQPLLQDDMTNAERITITFRIATTIIHEMALWGGEGKDIVDPSISQGDFGFANMGIFATNWFTKLHENYGNNPIPSPLKDSHYQSISSYLLKNRGPLELALDTMDFDIPEATLYRYIIERGGLIISPRDFRSFLIQADKKGEYFEWWLEGWTGMVRRRKKGWPGNPRDTRDYLVPPVAGALSAQDQTVVDTIMQNNQFLLNVYMYWHEFRDMDYETLRCFINKEVQDKWRIKASSMEDLVRFFHGNGGGVYLMHGPKGIARLKVVIPQWIKDTVDHTVGGNPAAA